jgi:hypothetical protein
LDHDGNTSWSCVVVSLVKEVMLASMLFWDGSHNCFSKLGRRRTFGVRHSEKDKFFVNISFFIAVYILIPVVWVSAFGVKCI